MASLHVSHAVLKHRSGAWSNDFSLRATNLLSCCTPLQPTFQSHLRLRGKRDRTWKVITPSFRPRVAAATSPPVSFFGPFASAFLLHDVRAEFRMQVLLSTLQKILPSSVLAGGPVLIGTLIPLVLTFYISQRLNLGLHKEIRVAVLRATVQLSALGFALKLVFEGRNTGLSVFAMMIMVFAAGHTAGERVKLVPGSQLISTLALIGGAFGTVWLMVLLKVFPMEPRYLITSTGFLVGNSMTVVGITLNSIHHDISLHEQQIEAALALGATPYQAIQIHLRRSLIKGLGPIFDYMKVAGLVTLPGAMTGMLMSGSHPLEAARSSLILLYMLVGAASLTSVIGVEIGWRTLFTRSFQLRKTARLVEVCM